MAQNRITSIVVNIQVMKCDTWVTITSCMQFGPLLNSRVLTAPWGVDRCSASQEIPAFVEAFVMVVMNGV